MSTLPRDCRSSLARILRASLTRFLINSQLNSMLYRFFPGVHWSKAFPLRDEILSQIRSIWQEYGLESRTRFNTKVTKVYRYDEFSTDPKKYGHGRWTVNDGEDGIFDAVFATVGSCGEPKSVEFKDQGKYEKGRIVHSSELDNLKPEEIMGHKVVIVGSGASGVEAAELAVTKGADDIKIIARDDKVLPMTLLDILDSATHPVCFSGSYRGTSFSTPCSQHNLLVAKRS